MHALKRIQELRPGDVYIYADNNVINCVRIVVHNDGEVFISFNTSSRECVTSKRADFTCDVLMRLIDVIPNFRISDFLKC